MKPNNFFYPLFEANQVLKADQLNQLVSYLEEQDRLTRNTLIGVGIVCGLHAAKHATLPQISLSKGCGITSEGYLIISEDKTFTRYRAYSDPVKYTLFRDAGGKQLDLWELLPDEQQDEAALTNSFLQDKAILLYLECREEDLKACTGNDCDEKGRRLTFSVKTLLMEKTHAEQLLREMYALSEEESVTDYLQGKFALPDLALKRMMRELDTSKDIRIDQIHTAYTNVITSMLPSLTQALQQCYTCYKRILKDLYPRNPFTANALENIFKPFSTASQQGIQYFYDFLKDLIAAYHEFKTLAFDMIAECCPDETRFPRHLMLGETIANTQCVPSIYRQTFTPAPVHPEQQQQREDHLRLLFQRMTLLIDHFNIPSISGAEIKMTPDKSPGMPLSVRSIPYYYAISRLIGSMPPYPAITPKSSLSLPTDFTLADRLHVEKQPTRADLATVPGIFPYYPALWSTPLNEFWNFDLKRRCKQDQILSYHVEQYALTTTLDFIRNPLAYSLDEYPFIRIEGHIGKNIDAALEEILALSQEAFLPIKVLALKLGSDYQDIAPVFDCRFQDLEALYYSLRSELLCLLEKEQAFFQRLTFVSSPPEYKAAQETGLQVNLIDASGRSRQYLERTQVLVKDAYFKDVIAQATVNEAGMFVFTDLKPGKYYVVVKSEDFQAAEKLITIEAQNVLHEKILTGARSQSAAIDRGTLAAAAAMESSFTKANTEDMIGQFLAEYQETAESVDYVTFAYQYIEKYPFVSRLDFSDALVRALTFPVAILQKIQALIDLVTPELRRFDYQAFGTHIASIQQTAQKYQLQILENLNSRTYKPRGNEQEILKHLQLLQDLCQQQGFNTLAETYAARVAEIQRLHLFTYFLQKHPGMEHQAGVAKGGTFILAYDEEGVVAADFALPYICCSDCPPIQICITTPAPLEITADFEYEVLSVDMDRNQAEVKFSAKPDSAEHYAWDFGDGGASTDQECMHKFVLSERQQMIDDLEFLRTALGSHMVDYNTFPEELSDILLNGIPAEIPDPGDGQWEYRLTDDGQGYQLWHSKYADIIMETGRFLNDIGQVVYPEKIEFQVTLKVIKGKSTSEISKKVIIETCRAEFSYDEKDPGSESIDIEFTSVYAADDYTWYEGTQKISDQRSFRHTFALSDREQQITVTLQTQQGNCSDSESKILTLPGKRYARLQLILNVAEEELQHINILINEHEYHLSIDEPATPFQDIEAGVIHINAMRPGDDLSIAEFEGTIEAGKSYALILNGVLNVDTFQHYNPDPNHRNIALQFFLIPDVRETANDHSKIELMFFHGSIALPALGVNASTIDASSSVYITEKIDYGENTGYRSFPPLYYVFLMSSLMNSNSFTTVINADLSQVAPGAIAICISSCFFSVDYNAFHGILVVFADGKAVGLRPATGGYFQPHYFIAALDSRLAALEKLAAHETFKTTLTTTEELVYRDTFGYLKTLKSEIQEPAGYNLYVKGEKNGEIAEQFQHLFDQTYTKIAGFRGETIKEKRQFVYQQIFLLQLEQFFNVLDIQDKDVTTDSPFIAIFKSLYTQLRAMQEMGIALNPENLFENLCQSSLKMASNKPIYAEYLQTLRKVIQ